MVGTWEVVFTKQAAKDAKTLRAAVLDKKAKALVEAVRANPFVVPPTYEALVGNLSSLYSRRINLQHRFVYQVIEGKHGKSGVAYEGLIRVVRMWTHYDGL